MLVKVFELNQVNQSYFVVGIPRGHYKQQELRGLLDDVYKLYREEHPPPPDTRKPGYLGSVEEWDAFLLVGSEGDLNSACIERLTSKVKEKEGRSLKPGEAEKAYDKYRLSITKQKKRIDHLISLSYSRTQVNTLIDWDATSLGVYFYFGKESGPFRSSNRAFQEILKYT